MSEPPVRLVVEGRLARITLCSQGRGNPVDPDMVHALLQAVQGALYADAAVVLIDAKGPTFSVGGDVAGFAAAESPGRHVAELAEGLHRVLAELARMPAIVVTVVRGTAAGAGVSLAAAGDVVLASSAARFVLAYTKVGLSPDGGASLLPATLGLHRALYLALLNPVLTAAQAREAGLVAQVHEDADLDGAVDEVLGALLRGSREAQVATKRLLRAQAAPAPETAMSHEVTSISRLAAGPDGLEGVAAFLAKRRPQFPSSN